MNRSNKISHHWQLDVYKLSVDAAMRLFELSKSFPKEELYSLTDQGRRSSRSVSGHIAEGWRRRRYEAAFCDKLNGAEAEAAETQTWIEYAVRCGYFTAKQGRDLHRLYDSIIGKLVVMQNHPEPWLLLRSNRTK
ncbi:MAG TPA: four helix bundle protein [Verrucomicrobiae bacterium]|jgi:four helix bundle protein|nr:four helix bundle protein [Verrucomicrobiae bacterium]